MSSGWELHESALLLRGPSRSSLASPAAPCVLAADELHSYVDLSGVAGQKSWSPASYFVSLAIRDTLFIVIVIKL